MSDNPLAVLIPPPSSTDEAEYDSICAAVMETARGRWFLTEYARRNRSNDTESGLAAIQRIETAIRGEQGAQSFDRFRVDVLEMAQAIARTKAEIAAIEPDTAHYSSSEDAKEEFVSRKLIQALELLEGRITSMIDIWGEDVVEVAPPEDKAVEAPLIDVASPPDVELVQEDVDTAPEPPTLSAEPRQDASIEDIGRSMLALDPLMAAALHETVEAPEQTPVEENTAALEIVAGDSNETEEAVDSAPQPIVSDETMGPVLTPPNLTMDERADTAAVVEIESIRHEAMAELPAFPTTSHAGIFNRIQAALHLAPRALPKPTHQEAAQSFAPAENLPPEPVAVSHPQEFMPAFDLDASSAIPAVTEPEPDIEAEETVAGDPLGLLDLSFVVEPPAQSAPIEASSSAEPETIEEPPPSVPVEEPIQPVAALEIEAADFLFEPFPAEVSPAAATGEQASVPPPYEMDPADFLFAPVPAVPVAAETEAPMEAVAATPPFEDLLAKALELPTSEAIASEAVQTSQASEPLPAMQWAAAVVMANPAPSMGTSAAFASRLAAKPAARTQNDPLAALLALSDEEKIALFS